MASTVVKDRKEYRIWNVVDKVWHRLNFLTNANSVDAADGKNLQTKVGAIDGITSDINGESDRIAASIKCVNTLKNNHLGGFTPVIDSTGKITGYKTKVGADTVFPFKSSYNISARIRTQDGNFTTVYIEILVDNEVVSSDVICITEIDGPILASSINGKSTSCVI